MNKGHGQKMTRKQETAIAALMTSSTIAKAAAAVPVAESTLRRWLGDEAFGQRYAEARQEVLAGVIRGLQHTGSAAVAVLTKVMSDSTEPAAARVSAARSLLQLMFHGVETIDLADRLTRVERRLRTK